MMIGAAALICIVADLVLVARCDGCGDQYIPPKRIPCPGCRRSLVEARTGGLTMGHALRESDRLRRERGA